MKIKYIIIITILTIKVMMSQNGFTLDELRGFKEQVIETKKLGKDSIIAMAAKVASDGTKPLFQDKNVFISVWYNSIQVKVEFIEHSPIRYIPYNSNCVTKMEVYVSANGVSGTSGSGMFESDGYVNDISKPTYLYRTTKQKEAIIDKVIVLNNANDNVSNIDKSINNGIIIREQKNHYAIQIGLSYPINYKIEKQSGRVYDYEDLYRDFYPTPVSMGITPPQIGGEWIEMKE